MNSKGHIIVFSAPSGSGKTTILQRVFLDFPDAVFSVSATTRKPRPHEVHGREYFFLSEEEFMQKVAAGEFAEWERFYDYCYGTLRSYIAESVEKGKTVFLDLDVKGALSIKSAFPEAALIFIMPPGISTLEERLVKRNTETDEDLKKRIDRARMELGYADRFDHIIVNDELEPAVQKTIETVKKITE